MTLLVSISWKFEIKLNSFLSLFFLVVSFGYSPSNEDGFEGSPSVDVCVELLSGELLSGELFQSQVIPLMLTSGSATNGATSMLILCVDLHNNSRIIGFFG